MAIGHAGAGRGGARGICSPSPRCVFLLAVLLLLPSLAAAADPATPPLPILTTAHQAHSLTAEEALRGYPIHLRGVLTLYDAYVDPRFIIMFVHDATGSMFFSVPTGSVGPIAPGTLVDVRGVSGMGDFAPIIAQSSVSVIGPSHLPASAPEVSLTYLITGQEDGQWIGVQGVVHSVFESEHSIGLEVAMRDGMVPALMPREPGRTYSSLVDALVNIQANASPLFNGEGQMIGARLLIPNLSAVQILEPGVSDVFALPTQAIETLSRFTPRVSLPRRIHLHGRVTLFWPGSMVCIRDATRGLCAHTAQSTPLTLGNWVDVVGFLKTGGSSPTLSDAVYRDAADPFSPATDPIPPQAVSPDQALHGRYDSELVQIEGQLIGRELAASETTLMLASKGLVYAVQLPQGLAVPGAWRNGAHLLVTGICSVQLDAERTAVQGGEAVRKSFRILLRNKDDIVILQQPSWWTPAHTVPVLIIALLITLPVLAWGVIVTRRLKQQTRVIQKSEEAFRHMAQHDALTGLPTRLLLRERLDAAIVAAKGAGTGLALLMLDLDNFKLINDSLGHSAGDAALKIAAQRLSGVVRRSDTVARISGDEFVVLICDLKEDHEAELVAAKVVAALCSPFRHGDREVPLSASVGICAASHGGFDADTMLKSADAAMYHAKAQGRNCFQLYTPDMARVAEANLRLRAGLHQALPAQELELHYQPIVDCQSGELSGFEALLRWRSKDMGVIMPSDFIPVAEQTGMIVPIGEWVLREACREIGLLEEQMGRSFLLSVNLSPRQIQQQHDLPSTIRRALVEAGRPAHKVEFEITESMLMNDSDSTHSTLMQLREMGVRLSIDDFGIGFSSLSYITRFSIDRIKIDRSFIQKCRLQGSNIAVVRAMIAMAHGLSMTVVAEGVETAQEFRLLREEGCDMAQGYYFSRPVPACELPLLLCFVREQLGFQSSPPTNSQPGSQAISPALQS